MTPIYIYFQDGTFLEAKSFGVNGTKTGEMVFNTSMSGYQEIMSDPSYAGQFVVFTFPEIGNVGCNDDDMESSKIFSSGMIVRNYQERISNFRGIKSLATFLKEHDSFGITDIDTRELTKLVRDNGPQMMVVSTDIKTKEELKAYLDKSKKIEEIDFTSIVSTKESYTHTSSIWDNETLSFKKAENLTKKIIAIDFGIKKNILNELVNVGFDVEVIPSDFDEDKLISDFKDKKIDGVFLSNGPGDPLVLREISLKIKKLSEAKVPMIAICLGHQLLSIANGHDTYKLAFGQHGANHPVQGEKGLVEITAQNHNYNVPKSLENIADVTHINLFDQTVEGVRYKNLPIFSVQHHPEASPGPRDSSYIFQEFKDFIDIESDKNR